MENKDSPPRSSDPSVEDLDDEELVYIGDADEVLDFLDDEEPEPMEDDEVPEDRDSITVFDKHKSSVFCGSLTKDGKLAATGGQDDIAYIWDTTTGEVIHQCTGHKDSIIFAEFNRADTYLATGDMSGIIQVWKMSDKTLVWDFNMGDATWMGWHKQASVLFAGSVEGEIYMWRIPSGDCKIFQGNGQRPETATVVADGKKLVVGYEDGSIRVMDLKDGTISVTIPPSAAHSAAITDLDCQFDGKLIVSGAMDGKTVLTTTQTGKIVGVIQSLYENRPAATAEAESSEAETPDNWVEAVAFCKNPELHLLATGTLNGEIFIWDTTKQIIRHKITQESGISKLVWKGTSPILFSAGLDGILRCYDARTGQCLKSFWGHDADILDVYISGDGNRILTTSDDSTAQIFDISQY